MAITKQELLNNKRYKTQQDIVKRLQEEREPKPIVHVIPGGYRIHQTLNNVEALSGAIYTWLRKTRAFTRVEICFAKDKSQMQLSQSEIQSYNRNNTKEEWELDPDGRRSLAEDLAKIILTYNPVSVFADKTGIYIQEDETTTFGPTKTITQEDLENLRTLGQEILEEAIDNGQDPDDIDLPTYEIGEKIVAENWEPRVIFHPKPKSGGYGN